MVGLTVVVGSILDILSVLLQQDISVLSAGAVRRGDIVLLDFQPANDLFGGLVIRRPAFRVKFGQYLVQALDAGLCVINKSQYAPTNCRRLGDSSVPSSMLFMLVQILFIL
jgi:hypothetical protein